jgi:hypothetical protein
MHIKMEHMSISALSQSQKERGEVGILLKKSLFLL